MSLSEAILACLSEKPQSGYELAKFFEQSIGFFWHAEHQRIYRELKSLSKKKWVASETVEQVGRPDKKIYTITGEGKDRLYIWSKEPSKIPSFKDDMMVKFHALDHADLEAIEEQILNRRALHEEQTSKYEAIQANYYSNIAANDARMIGRSLGLNIGLKQEAIWLEWCDEALEQIRSLRKEAAS